MTVMAALPVQFLIWSVPLAHKATAMRITDTAGRCPGRSGAAPRSMIRPGSL
jgi:hypothetical protein